MINVLFVCEGNICRSPLAEGIFKHMVRERNLQEHFYVDSAGTSAYHVGEPPDTRSQQVAAKHGVKLTGHSRRFTQQDFTNFDMILAMDKNNFRNIKAMAGSEHEHKVKMMREYDSPEFKGQDVPDPYYGGANGFNNNYTMLYTSCQNLLDELSASMQD